MTDPTSFGPRASGRTYRALQAAPDGAVFIVSCTAMINHCRHELVKMGRKSNALKCVSAQQPDLPYRLRGLRRSMVHFDRDWAHLLFNRKDMAQHDAVMQALYGLHD